MSEDDLIREIFARTRTIAVVGLSPKPDRPSHRVPALLQRLGYRIIPVNPTNAGRVVLGEMTWPDLASIPERESVDMVEIFRRSEDVPPVVDEALATLANLRTVWMQLGISNAAAAEKARGRGVDVIQNRCPAIEIPRLGIVPPTRS